MRKNTFAISILLLLSFIMFACAKYQPQLPLASSIPITHEITAYQEGQQSRSSSCPLVIAIPPLNSSARAENSGRINAFSATGGVDLKVNCYRDSCGSAPLPPDIELLCKENHVEVPENLDGIIFNARFLDIPTYENSGQIAHPHILFFREKLAGFHYIMVMTPYPFSNDAHENPSILGSNDGITWEVPKGVINPIFGPPDDVAHGGYYSDPFILQNGEKLDLWFRYNPALNTNGQKIRRNSHNRIFRSESWDLVNWSEPEIMLDCPGKINHFMSVAIIHDGPVYRLWYTNFNSILYYIESSDMINWSERRHVQADLNGLGIWHHDISFTGEKYEALFTSADWDNQPVFRLFYASSADGLNFGTGHEIIIDRISPELKGMTIHKSTYVKTHGTYQMYLPVFNHNNVWKLFYLEISEENLHYLF